MTPNTHLVKLLVEYVQDGQEHRDYQDWCRENGRDTEDYAGNVDHIYAVSELVRLALYRETEVSP